MAKLAPKVSLQFLDINGSNVLDNIELNNVFNNTLKYKDEVRASKPSHPLNQEDILSTNRSYGSTLR